jgi:hypothetical protein
MSDWILKLFWGICLIFSTLIGFYPLMMTHAVSAAVLDAGMGHTCGIQADNTVVCWGKNNLGQATPPSGTFLQVSTGHRHTCGVQTNKTVACWGYNKDEQATPPSGSFLQVSAGWFHTCGIRTNNTVACWGKNKENDYDQSTPPNGTFLQVSAGRLHTCGILTDNTVTCWGSNKFKEELLGQATPPNGPFSQISAGAYHNCGIQADDTVLCWGGDADTSGTPPKDTFAFSQISAGMYYTCGLKNDNTPACWGWNEMGQAKPPNGTCISRSDKYPREVCSSSSKMTFSHVSTGKGGEREVHTCGILADNTVICWGYNGEGQATPPPCLRVKSSGPQTVESLAYGILYGVHADGKKDSQFFTLDSRILEANPFGEVYENYDITAIDSHPLTYQIFAVSGENAKQKGYLYHVERNSKKGVELSELGKTGFQIVAGISFHPDGTLWGWAQGEGLFKIENDENNEPDISQIELVLPYQGEVKLEDLTWNATGTTLFAVENLYEEVAQAGDEKETLTKAKGVRLWNYTQTGTISTVCDTRLNSLEEEIEAIETLPGDNDTLLFHFGGHENLTFGIMDVQKCQIVRKEIPTSYYVYERGDPPVYKDRVRSYNNVRSLAWIACQP